VRAFLPIVLISCCAIAQSVPHNRLTFSGGWSRQVGGNSYEHETATGLGLSYGYRVHNFIEAEAGVFTALQPSPDIRGANYFLNPNDRFIWIPFGVRFVAPLYLKPIEFSAGGGGLYEKYSVSKATSNFGIAPRDGWGGYFAASAAVALDGVKHFWIGATPRWFLANPPFTRDRWFQISGELTLRFR
jgi:hypothetical protein